MKFIKTSLMAACVVTAVAALSGCAAYDDGYYGRGYSNVRVGVSSGPGYNGYPRYGYRGYYRDRDGDGIPNRYDNYPYNPYRP